MARIMPYLLFSNVIPRASSGFNSPGRYADVGLYSILAHHVVTNGEWFASVCVKGGGNLVFQHNAL